MKAIVLWQPWATLMALGLKRNETRPRPWSFIGDVAIVAGKHKIGRGVPDYMSTSLCALWHARSALPPARDVQQLYYALPFGKVVCVVEKVGCFGTESVEVGHLQNGSVELALGDYSPGRFYYPTIRCRRLAVPVACSGSQGVFDLPADVEAAVRAQI